MSDAPSNDVETPRELSFDRARAATIPGASLARHRTRASLFGGESPRTVGRFTLTRHLGSGGMGTVYAAQDPELDREVAVKLTRLREGSGDAARARDRMLVEARAMAQLAHPNVITVYEVGLVDTSGAQNLYVAMERVAGRTLREWQREAEPGWREALAAYVQAGHGLAAVHEASLVHRDFKPDNAMIDADGRVYVMDFGLARDARPTRDESSEAPPSAGVGKDLTRTGDLVGTPGYMAPEQLEGRAATPASDQYSFCVALYEALWGRRPFGADSLGGLIAAVLEGPRPQPPPSPVPRRVRAAVLRGLSVDPDERFPDLAALLTQLTGTGFGWRPWALAASGAAALGAWVLWSEPPRDPPCEAGAEAFEDAWSSLDARDLAAAFAESSVPAAQSQAARVASALDRYAEQWAEQFRAACNASGRALDQRMRCLERRKSEAQRLVEVFVSADTTTVEHAEDAVAQLTPAQRCADPAFLESGYEPPTDPATVAAVADAQRRLDEIRALRSTGRVQEALSLARALAAEPTVTDFRPVAVRIAFEHGRLQFEAGDAERSAQLLEEAFLEAKSIGQADYAFEAALQLVAVQAGVVGDVDAASRWQRTAEAESATIAMPDREDRLLEMEVELLTRRGEMDAAIQAAERRLAKLEADCAECATTADALLGLSDLYGPFGRTDEAIAHAQRALVLNEALHGREHADVARAHSLLGDALGYALRSKDALHHFEQAVAIRSRVLGPRSVNLALTRIALGNSLTALGRPAEAVEHITAAKSALAEVGAQDAGLRADNALGLAYDELGRPADAILAYESALRAVEARFPDGHPAISIIMSNIADARGQLGEHAEAAALLESALENRRAAVDGPDPQQAVFLFNMAGWLEEAEQTEEAAARYREAMVITETGSIGRLGVRIRIAFADLTWSSSPARAAAAVKDALERCAELPQAQQDQASCEEARQWTDAHPL